MVFGHILGRGTGLEIGSRANITKKVKNPWSRVLWVCLTEQSRAVLECDCPNVGFAVSFRNVNSASDGGHNCVVASQKNCGL